MKSICWFRNDLRVLDNPAFHHCCLNSDEVIAIYFLNRKQWVEHNDAPVKINFWLRNLECLQNELKKLNIPLIVLEADTYRDTISVLKDLPALLCQRNMYILRG